MDCPHPSRYVRLRPCIDTVPVVLDGFTNFNKPLILLLVSRRSRYRAGTRYKRRGFDDNGYVANYVETEQCLLFGDHVLSFVQIRGSVPVYCSQPGFKYRPPPQIDRGNCSFLLLYVMTHD